MNLQPLRRPRLRRTTTWSERVLIQADLVARLKRRPHRVDQLATVGTPEQTRLELMVLLQAGIIEEKDGRWSYVGWGKFLPRQRARGRRRGIRVEPSRAP